MHKVRRLHAELTAHPGDRAHLHMHAGSPAREAAKHSHWGGGKHRHDADCESLELLAAVAEPNDASAPHVSPSTARGGALGT